MKTIKVSDIKISFGGKNNPPKDEMLIHLLKKAYRGDLMCHMAVIDWEGIKPFSDYRPKIAQDFENYFLSAIKNKEHPALYVYQDGDKFIMSDDYNSYYLYQKYGHDQVLTIVLGDPEGKYVISKGEAFKLPLPTVEVINK